MTIRAKLTLALGGLALLAVALGVAGVVLLGRLGPAVDVVLRDNQRSVLAMQRVKEGLEREDSGALFGLLGEIARAEALVRANDRIVRDAIALELTNVTVPGEGEQAERLARAYGQYRAAAPAILDPTRPADERQRLYFETLLPAFTETKAAADSVLALNQAQIVRANGEARALAQSGKELMLGLLLGAVLLAAGAVFAGERLVVRPLRRLTRAVRSAQAGDLDVVVPAETRDEVGTLAGAFNDLTAALREIRRTDRARLLRTQHATQAAVDALPDAVALVSPQGVVELSNRTARRLFALEPGTVAAQAVPALAAVLERPGRGEARRTGLGGAPLVQAFDGTTERFFQPQAVAVRDDRHDLAGVLLVLGDVTDLRAADELRSDWRMRTAHEIGSPVTSLQMAIHLLLEDREGTLSPAQTELLVVAREDAEALARIARSVTDEPLAAAPAAPAEAPLLPSRPSTR